ncbi:MAG: hypothetical protein ACI87W_000223 [Halieaceae bacterium]|jgi:hypothetical protein
MLKPPIPQRRSASRLCTYCLLLIAALCTPLSQVEARPPGADPLFADPDPLSITLTGPFSEINRKRDKEQEYAGTLSYANEDGETTVLDVKYSVRGNFRLQNKVCSYAQLWINLKKSQVKDTLFHKQNKLKLVVQCRDSERFREFIAREEHAYRMFQTLSDISLGTRLLEVNYVDTAGDDDSRTQTAFFIQHQKRLAKQLDMDVLDLPSADKARLDEPQSALVALFMYMVSNTDYSMIASPPGQNCCHNTKVLAASTGALYPVPYDFDSTGYVNASYAEPSGDLKQRSVRQRIYRGFCVSDEAQDRALAIMREKRASIYRILEDNRYLKDKSVKKSRKFIDDFYSVIDDPRDLQYAVIGKCR